MCFSRKRLILTSEKTLKTGWYSSLKQAWFWRLWSTSYIQIQKYVIRRYDSKLRVQCKTWRPRIRTNGSFPKCLKQRIRSVLNRNIFKLLPLLLSKDSTVETASFAKRRFYPSTFSLEAINRRLCCITKTTIHKSKTLKGNTLSRISKTQRVAAQICVDILLFKLFQPAYLEALL